MDSNVAPVILINEFTVKPEEVDQFLEIWAAAAAIMKRQPGFISTQLHRGIAGSCVFISVAVFESAQHFKHVFNNPELQSTVEKYPASTTYAPHLFNKVAVAGLCVE